MEFQYIKDSDIAQIRNIIDNNPLIALDVMRDCADVTGLSTKSEYSRVLNIAKRTVQDGCKKGNIVSLEINSEKFPCINCHLSR